MKRGKKPGNYLFSTRAQVEIQFNWIYILVAGIVILAFFVGIVIQQKKSAETRLHADVQRTLQTIFTGAAVAQSTKQAIEIPPSKLSFFCDASGASGVQIEGAPVPFDTPIQPIFAPHELGTDKLVLWSLPYEMPFRITNVLLVTVPKGSPAIKYIVIGDYLFVIENMVKQTYFEAQGKPTEMNFEFISPFDATLISNKIPQNAKTQLRFVFFDGIGMDDAKEALADVPNKATAVSFNIASKQATYYAFEGKGWIRGDDVSLPTLTSFQSSDDTDALFYAALFAADAEQFNCNMKKIFGKMEMISELYEKKTERLRSQYDALFPFTQCTGGTVEAGEAGEKDEQRLCTCQFRLQDAQTALQALHGAITQCKSSSTECINIISPAREVGKLHDPAIQSSLVGQTCTTIY